jgi:hypothetical protein
VTLLTSFLSTFGGVNYPAVQTPIEIRYEGTVIGTATSTSGSLDDGTLYLATDEPMPVGTKLELTSGRDVTQVRVVRVAESTDANAVGMVVRALSASEPLEIPMPPVAVVPPRPALPPGNAGPSRPVSSSTPSRAPSYAAPPRPVTPVPPAAPPPAPAPAPPPGPPQSAVKGEINRPSQSMPTVKDHEAVPEPVGGDDSLNGTSGSVQVEVSGMIETDSTAELPAVGNGANRRKRSRRKR